MKYIRIAADGGPRWAVCREDRALLLAAAPYEGISYTGESLPLSEVRLLAPCEPSKIVAVGKNYFDHIREVGGDAAVPKNPILFLKPPSALIGPEESIVIPKGAGRVDHECELAFIVSRRAKNVAAADAPDYILGYTCLNDVTDRTVQASDGQWVRAKGCDTFCPVGPLVTDEVSPADLAICSRVNGVTRQEARTNVFIWDVPALFEFITASMTLLPGDVVTTGTPAGIGPLLPGDVVEVEVEGIGILRNPVIAAV